MPLVLPPNLPEGVVGLLGVRVGVADQSARARVAVKSLVAVKRVGPSPVISVLAQCRLVRVVGSGGGRGGGREARMRRSRGVLGVEAVLWKQQPGVAASRTPPSSSSSPRPRVLRASLPSPDGP